MGFFFSDVATSRGYSCALKQHEEYDAESVVKSILSFFLFFSFLNPQV